MVQYFLILGIAVAPYAVGTDLMEENDEEEQRRKADYFSALNVWVRLWEK